MGSGLAWSFDFFACRSWVKIDKTLSCGTEIFFSQVLYTFLWSFLKSVLLNVSNSYRNSLKYLFIYIQETLNVWARLLFLDWSICQWKLQICANLNRLSREEERKNCSAPVSNFFLCFLLFVFQTIFSRLEILALMIATLSHDIDHRGVSNSYIER